MVGVRSVLAAVTLATLACAGEASAQPSLDGSSWTLLSIDGRAAAGAATLMFANGRASGATACNHFSGPYSMRGLRISFGALGTTRMMCPPDRMRAQRWYLSALHGARRRAELGERLRLSGSGGVLEFERAN